MMTVGHQLRTAAISLGIAILSAAAAGAQTKPDVQYITEYLKGHEFQITYREGGVQYGTFFFLDVHFCASGAYWSTNQSRKQTVLGNEQVNNWNDSGQWTVAPVQGVPALHYRSASGAQDIAPLQVHADGSVGLLSGAFMKRVGKALCR